jgi:hypothetical protein
MGKTNENKVNCSPPGLEEVFRAWGTPGLTKEQIAAIERKHGLVWKQPK